jgi:ribosomal protein S18 acetylase RimI-like enzyme
MFTRTTLDRIEPARRAAAFNAVYENYLMPVALTDEQFRDHVTTHDVLASGSPVWLDDDGAVAALALLGVRGERGWIGGFGIAAAHRGRGLSHALTEETLANARTLGLQDVRLEVLVDNPRAIRSYETAGFVRTRDLRVLVRPGDAPALPVAALAITPVAVDRAIAIGAAFDRTAPCWQREPASLAHVNGLEGLAFGNEASPSAAALARRIGDGVRIGLFAARDGTAAAGALAALIARWPGAGITVVNEPEESPLQATYAACGFREVHRQHEMIRALAASKRTEAAGDAAGAALR